MENTFIKYFDNKPIRGIYDYSNNTGYFSATDIIDILVVTKNSRKYWNTLKSRKPDLTHISKSIKLKSHDEKHYICDGLDIDGVKTLLSHFDYPYCGQLLHFLKTFFHKHIENEEDELIDVIKEYSYALDILDRYDHQQLDKPKGSLSVYALTYEDAIKIINKMKYCGSSSVFGVEKEKGKLKGILDIINQNVFGEEVYKTFEDKAAHLLYFLVKDHPFADGCKRIAATLFLEYLNRNNKLVVDNDLLISNKTLASITLLTAQSKPEDMEIIINVIMHFLANE